MKLVVLFSLSLDVMYIMRKATTVATCTGLGVE